MSVTEEIIGGYRLVSTLGSGPTGTVFLGKHATVGSEVAIKRLASELVGDRERVQRWVSGARRASRIAHTATVKISDVITGGEHVHVVMERLHGETLATRLQRGRMSSAQIVELVRQVTAVTAALHDDDLIHGDLRPAKIFVVRDGLAVERVKLLISDQVLLGPDHAAVAPYCAPECWGHGAVDWRVDLYALGCMIFEMATGQPPYRGSADELRAKHADPNIPTARSLMPDVPPALDAVIARLIAPSLDQRAKSMREIARELDGLGSTSQPLASTVQDEPVLVRGELDARTLPGGTRTVAEPPRAPAPDHGSRPKRWWEFWK